MAVTATRPLWFLGPNGMPVRSDARRIPPGATHSAHEGDAHWRPLEARPGAQSNRVGSPDVPRLKIAPEASWEV